MCVVFDGSKNGNISSQRNSQRLWLHFSLSLLHFACFFAWLAENNLASKVGGAGFYIKKVSH